MPMYCFKNEDGNRIERFYPFAKMPMKIKVKGVIYNRDILTEQSGRRSHSPACWPMVSVAAGVAAEQIPDVMAIDREHGLNVEYTSDGNPILKSAKERSKYLKAHGLVDRSSYY